ncbi:uncharacterized protein LOC143225069 isoform X1 [Tachypleus tridentatus]|uniref:uncharacterized protein LOC143225069 isoform X1 n=1 Tax=Tachypleus tridentatus TaxID=6853 RepID=UPI003FD52720
MNWLTSISLPCSSVSYLVGTSRNPALLILYGSKNSSNSNSCSRLNKYHNSKLTGEDHKLKQSKSMAVSNEIPWKTRSGTFLKYWFCHHFSTLPENQPHDD